MADNASEFLDGPVYRDYSSQTDSLSLQASEDPDKYPEKHPTHPPGCPEHTTDSKTTTDCGGECEDTTDNDRCTTDDECETTNVTTPCRDTTDKNSPCKDTTDKHSPCQDTTDKGGHCHHHHGGSGQVPGWQEPPAFH